MGLFNGFTLESEFVPSDNINEDAVRVTVEGQYGWFLLQLILGLMAHHDISHSRDALGMAITILTSRVEKNMNTVRNKRGVVLVFVAMGLLHVSPIPWPCA